MLPYNSVRNKDPLRCLKNIIIFIGTWINSASNCDKLKALTNLNPHWALKCIICDILDFRVLYRWWTAFTPPLSLNIEVQTSLQKGVTFPASVLNFALYSKVFSLHLPPHSFPNLRHCILILMREKEKRYQEALVCAEEEFCLFCSSARTVPAHSRHSIY